MTETRTELAAVRAGEELDWAALEAHLRANLPGMGTGFDVLQFPNGSANLTYQVRLGETRLVVRRPPFGRIAGGAHDMRREYLVLSTLNDAYPRAPKGLLFCDDGSIIGAPFLVAEYRPGVVVWDHIPASMQDAESPGRQIGFAVLDALADLHMVDYEACGLASLGRPGGYLQRQVTGWTRRWEAVAPETDGPVHRAGRILADRMPVSGAPTIVHNDFKVDNCQFAPAKPDTVVSVFDWDMATLGDPLTDLGTLLNYWPDGDPGQANAVPGLLRLGLPTRDEVVQRYLERRGVDLDPAVIDWYEAFGCWKTAVILQQLYARYARGETTDERMGERSTMVRPLAERALDLLCHA